MNDLAKIYGQTTQCDSSRAKGNEVTFAGGKSIKRGRHAEEEKGEEENCRKGKGRQTDDDKEKGRTKRDGAQTLPDQQQELKALFLMALCFCCCPVFRCVLWFCAFEAILSLFWWYSLLSDLLRTFGNNSTQLRDVLLLLLLTGWLVTLCVSTVSLFIARNKRDYQYVWPRLVQLSGLLLLGFLFALLLVIYFAGAAHRINSWLISFHEFAFSDPLDREGRQDAHELLRLYFVVLILLDFLFICYMALALCATKKYYKELRIEQTRGVFQRIGQNDPTAPSFQPPTNPNYKGSIS
ncbi:hypothetical protein niasHS_007298 [Heterodera schachtii]|uniref:Uncharacterized protein n=1 Tax=Heterodera schachtii TaxID=97005 RepID=A0ABD2JKD8_HETSC